jgi:hyaluronoglucosaminidase
MISGIIEGFYGPPWSHETRLDFIDFLADHGGNTYVWAAKLEPRHRELWAEPFTSDELAQFAELASQQEAVQVLIGLTPGSDATSEQLINKMRPVIEIGCHGVVLSFDDLPVLDAAAKHRDLANALVQHLNTQIWLVPTHYAGTTSSPYLEKLFDGLHEDVLVMWTGVHVVNDSITARDAQRRTAACDNRKPLLWDNTPVNDAIMSESLHLGPYSSREIALRHEISGLLLNPMEFASASKPTVASALAWLRAEDAITSWESFVSQCGWSEWWQSVADMQPGGLDVGCQPWIDAAKQGAALVLSARKLIAEPGDSEMSVLGRFHLAVKWRTWKRLPVLTYGGGPRIRPVVTNDENGKFAYRNGTVISPTSLVDDEVMRCLQNV